MYTLLWHSLGGVDVGGGQRVLQFGGAACEIGF